MSIHTDLQNLFTELETKRDGYSIPLAVEGKLRFVSVNSKEFSDSLESLIEKTVALLETTLNHKKLENIQPELIANLNTFCHIFANRLIVHAALLPSTPTTIQKIIALTYACPVEEQYALKNLQLIQMEQQIANEVLEDEEEDEELVEKRVELVESYSSTFINKFSDGRSSSSIPEKQRELIEMYFNPNSNSQLINDFWNTLRSGGNVKDFKPTTEADKKFCVLVKETLPNAPDDEFLKNCLAYANEHPETMLQLAKKFLDDWFEAKPIQDLGTGASTKTPTKELDELLDELE